MVDKNFASAEAASHQLSFLARQEWDPMPLYTLTTQVGVLNDEANADLAVQLRI